MTLAKNIRYLRKKNNWSQEELADKLGYKCRFHDLRHYYASALHAIGIRDQYIMKFGGWKSDSILKSVYRGTLDDFETEAVEKANAYFERQFR